MKLVRRVASTIAFSVLALEAAPASAQPPPVPNQAAPKLTKAPKLVKFVEAAYPDAEKAAGKTAAVVVQIAIAANGTVADARVADSAGPAFDAAALAAVRQFVFEPAEIDGKPSPIRILYKYEFTLQKETPTTAIFEGVVRTRGTKKPVAGATIELPGGKKVTTDEEGRFRVEDVPVGKLAISVSASGLTPVRTEETFEAGKLVKATYDVEPVEVKAPGETDDLEIVVQAPPLQKSVVTTEIPAEQARKVPGTSGDVLKVVEAMPGVGRPPAGTGQLVVWGSSPQDTRVYVDGVRVPLLYHFGGYRSVLSSELVKSVDLAPGGYGAEYGRGLGGLVSVQLRPMEADGFHGSVDVDFLDASAAARASIGDRWRVAVAARKSYLDALVPLVTSKDVGALFPIARYADAQFRLTYEPKKGETIEAGTLLSWDSVDRTIASADPQARDDQAQSTNWYRVYARYRRELDGGAFVTVTPSIGVDSNSLVSRFGDTPTEVTSKSTVYALRALYRGMVGEGVTVTGGLDFELTSTDVHRAGSISSPPREGDEHVFGQAPSDRIGSDSWSTNVGSVAAFAEADVPLLGGRVHVVPGARFEPYFITTSRRTPVVGDTPSVGAYTETTAVEPRLAVNVAITERLKAKAAWGVYHQAPAPEDLSAVYGNPLLDVASANQWLGGLETKLTSTLKVEATGFYTHSTGLAARSPYESPLLAQALEPFGEGRAFGAQFLIRQDLWKGFFGWVSYSIVRSERKDQTDGRWRLFDFDQTHVVTALASYEIGAGVEVGVRVRAATGFPRSPVVSAYYDARLDAYQPVFGVANTQRLPTFFQVDARVAKKWSFGKTMELEAYLDVQNATNRANPEEVVYSRNYSQKAYITGLPILPVLGARFSW